MRFQLGKSRFNHLKTMLLLAVAFLVVTTGIVVSQLVIRNYSSSLLSQAIAQAESIAHKLSLDVTDKILINDLVAVQKILDDQLQSETSVSYLLIINDNEVLVHTFQDGIPAKLIEVNQSGNLANKSIKNLVSQKGERFVDIRWPVFMAKAGVLRLGFSETPYRNKVKQLGMKMTLITLMVLAVSFFIGHALISRLIAPLLLLTDTVKNIDEDNLEGLIHVSGPAEINRLVGAYNGMIDRIAEHTSKLKRTNQALEQRNIDLDRAHKQFSTTFSVSQKIAALPDLKRICSFLVKTLQDIVECNNISMVVFDNDKKIPYLTLDNNFIVLNTDSFEVLYRQANQNQYPIFLKNGAIKALPLPDTSKSASRMAIFPFHHHHQVLGAILIACPDDCVCVKTEMDVIHMILAQASGAVFRAFEHEREISGLRGRIDTVAGFQGMVGKDPKIQIIYKLIEDVAPTEATVLIQGESGTGKEMVAQAIHDLSDRSIKPFIVINCSAYPATLLESELFGHEKGAFTGAHQRKIGRFEKASDGTVFLDEIGEISLSAQTMLLRVLQSQKIERIGGNESIKVNTRVLAATNRNLIDEVKKGTFREDLYYRLNVIPINLPPLNWRKNDIPLLASFFLKKFSTEQNKQIEKIDSGAMRLLLDYGWPGNIRELENCIEHAVTLSKSKQIFTSDLPDHFFDAIAVSPASSQKALKANEEKIIRKALDECSWNKTVTAVNLGISRSTLYEKLRKYNILPPQN